MTTLRGLSSAHRQPLIETRFLSDLEWKTRPYRWPLFVRIVFIGLASGVCWAAFIVLAVEAAAIIRSLA